MEQNTKILPQQLVQLPDALIPWYQQNARSLPWRIDREPYHVWLSEIMLQQTRVEAVKPYYIRFLKRLPTLRALSLCDEETLMKLWEGLGYYSRARNLRRAAKQIMETADGVFPSDYESLRRLPGVGEYTAGAIASICYDLPEPAVDGNVLRVMSRICADSRCIDEPVFRREIRAQLCIVYQQHGHCGILTQALMELGATICIPNGMPHCEQCPCKAFCAAKCANTVMQYPVRKKKKSRRIEYHTVYILRCDDQIALRKRPSRGLLAGMWELPHVDGKLAPQEALNAAASWNCMPSELVSVARRVHIFTHIEWHMTCVYLRCKACPEEFTWVPIAALAAETALPTAFRIALPDFSSETVSIFQCDRRGIHMEWMIRPAVASDIGALVELRLKQLASEGAVATCDLSEPLFAYYREVLTTGAQTMLVAVCEDRVIANGGISYVNKAPYYANPTGKIGVIFAMYTEPEFRRMGVGTAILQKLTKLARQRDCGELYVTASDMGVPFYESIGFKEHPNFRRLMLTGE